MDSSAACSVANSKQVFWAEIAPCDHLVQIYEEDGPFLDGLVAFVVAGLQAKETVIIIATQQHLTALDRLLWGQHFELIAAARSSERYMAMEAGELLSKFMVNDWPDEKLFVAQISALIAHARSRSPRVRAFGEMVALLWGRGLSGATVRLEHLWNQLLEKEGLPLFCAYPKSGFTQNAEQSLRDICALHTRTIC